MDSLPAGMRSEAREMVEERLLADLNPAQREAASAPAGPLLILAGAGSGKTRVLTRRIAWLIKARSVSPERILAVTFTNKAAGEMRDRIESLLGESVRGMWIGTFHAVCLRWLRRHARLAGFGPALAIVDAEDQLTLLRRILKGEGFDSTPRRARELQAIISRAKNRAQSPDDLEQDARSPAQLLAVRLYREYQAALKRQNGVDFDDLLLETHRLFRDHSEVADFYARQFEHILVDEYQDTNHVQFLLVERLARAHRNILVVGDDDQSIYGWRGAEVRNILEFREHFPNASVFYLEQNYRSTRPILGFANAVIARNAGRYEKTLWTERPGGEPPEFFMAPDEDEEAEEIARRAVREKEQEGHRYRDIAIFYRTHAQSRPIEDAFLRRGIPYIIVGGIYFYARREVKDLLSYLRVLVNSRDETSLRRALSVPKRGVGERTMELLMAQIGASEEDPLIVLKGGGPEEISGRARSAIVALADWMLELRERLSEPPERILAEIANHTAYRDYLQREGGEWEERVANVEELIESARLFSSREEGGVAEYLDQVSLLTSIDAMDSGTDAVTLMTAHNAKGLEFPVVFVTGVEEGLFPHASAVESQAEMEEERRLFYVACTRAMDRLTLSASELRRRYSTGAGGPSRFVTEVNPALLRVTGLASGPGMTGEDWGGSGSRGLRGARGSRSEATGGSRGARGSGGAGGSVREPEGEEHPWVGRRVYHARFGHGLVVSAEGRGEDARVTVRFHGGETRKLLRNYLEWEP